MSAVASSCAPGGAVFSGDGDGLRLGLRLTLRLGEELSSSSSS